MGDKKVAEWKAASTILGATHIPQAEEIAKALDAAAMVMKAVPAIAHWIGEISEGADDVYIQHAQDGQQAHDWVSIFPTDSSQIEMNTETRVTSRKSMGSTADCPWIWAMLPLSFV